MIPSLPLLPCGSPVSVKEKPDRKKKICVNKLVEDNFEVNDRVTETYHLRKILCVFNFFQSVTLFKHKINNLLFLSSNYFFALINNEHVIIKSFPCLTILSSAVLYSLFVFSSVILTVFLLHSLLFSLPINKS